MPNLSKVRLAGYGALLAAGLVAPFVAYPIFLMHALCFALFACAFNLLLAYRVALVRPCRLLRTAAYVTGHVVKTMAVPPD